MKMKEFGPQGAHVTGVPLDPPMSLEDHEHLCQSKSVADLWANFFFNFMRGFLLENLAKMYVDAPSRRVGTPCISL